MNLNSKKSDLQRQWIRSSKEQITIEFISSAMSNKGIFVCRGYSFEELPDASVHCQNLLLKNKDNFFNLWDDHH